MTLMKRQNHQRTEMLRQKQFQSVESTRERRREPLKIEIYKYKIEIYKYRRVDDYSLSRWFATIDGPIEARRIVDERMQIAFAQSYMFEDARIQAPFLRTVRLECVWDVDNL